MKAPTSLLRFPVMFLPPFLSFLFFFAVACLLVEPLVSALFILKFYGWCGEDTWSCRGTIQSAERNRSRNRNRSVVVAGPDRDKFTNFLLISLISLQAHEARSVDEARTGGP